MLRDVLNITIIESDNTNMITGPQIRAARALLGMDQKTLALRAGVSVPTIQRMEASEGNVRSVVESLTRVVAAIEEAGVELIADGADSASGGRGIRLKQPDAGRNARDTATNPRGTA